MKIPTYVGYRYFIW